MAGNSEVLEEEADESTVPDVWWHVNKNGFPVCEETWEKMWSYVLRVHPQGEEVARHIRGQKLKKARHDVWCPVHMLLADKCMELFSHTHMRAHGSVHSRCATSFAPTTCAFTAFLSTCPLPHGRCLTLLCLQ